jgi:hypothetical protein
MRPTPRSITRLATLLTAAATVGAAAFAIGIYQATWLSAHKSAALDAAASNDVYRAIANLESSSHTSMIAGGFAVLLVAGRFLVRKAVPFGLLALWILWAGVLLGTLFLIGDSSIGLTAYVDANGDVARQAAVNDLLIAPGRAALLIVAEIVMLIVLGWIAVLFAAEDTREFLKVRKEPAADSGWDAVLAAQRTRQE